MGFIETFQDQPIVLLIPLISAFVGWITNVLAIQMMFKPLSFIGIRPFLGWQGIIPANARKLARASTALMMDKLLKLPALLDNFDPEAFVSEVDHVVEDVTTEILGEVASGPMGAMWNNLGDEPKAQVTKMVAAEVRQVAVNVLGDLRDNIDQLLDLGDVVDDLVDRDRAVVGEMFRTVGDEEFRFIERSGVWFGFAFGVVQMIVWALYPAWWILPLAGFGVGYATNWVALKLIFEPKEPRKFGPITIDGLFHKRQQEVVKGYATMVGGRIFNADNLTATMTTRRSKDKLVEIIRARVIEAVDRYSDHPMAKMAPASMREELETKAIARLEEDLDKPGGFLHTFAEKSVDIQGTLVDQMGSMSPAEFEGVLRPAFQEDEWKLIMAGAALGLGAGVLQVVYVFGEMML